MKWLLAILLSLPAWANNTFDANGITCTQASGSSCIASITTSATATMMVVAMWGYTGSNGVSAVKFNTFTTNWVQQKQEWDGSHSARVELWTRASPAQSTTANVEVDLSSTSSNWGFFAYTLSGTKTASYTDGTPCGAVTAAATNGSLACGAITTATDGSWVIDVFLASPNTTTISVGSGQTSLITDSTFSAHGAARLENHPAGSYNDSWSWTGTTNSFSAIAALGIQPAAYTPPGGSTSGVQMSIGLP